MGLVLAVSGAISSAHPLQQTGKSAAAAVAGAVIVEPPTLICLGFEWEVSGDATRNAIVEVVFRKAGEKNWRDALPLLRMGG